MNPIDIIEKYYKRETESYHILVEHSRRVAEKAILLAEMHPEMHLNLSFIEEASMLHDIGIFRTNAPDIDCHGAADYICHGYLGADLMRNEGYPLHALVCERHTGTGLSLDSIIARNLPIPRRDMQPQSMEEQIICFADKFFSKTKLNHEKSVEKVRKGLERYGEASVLRFDAWCKLFLGE